MRLDRLESVDGAAELLALRGVGDRVVEGRAGHPEGEPRRHDPDLGQEFQAIILQLKIRLAEQQISQLLRQTNLSAEEKSRLRALLNQRSK